MKTQNDTMADRSFSSVELLPVSKHAAAPPPPLPRRTFLRRLGMGAAFLAPGAGLISTASIARAGAGTLTQGDVDILRFLAAAEIIETDLWQQYTELGGQDSKESPYRAALEILDEDQPQYISDNTDDEQSHVDFLNAFLSAAGASPVNLDQFRTLPSSQATGAQQIGRLTNLMQLTIDTSWWTRYRSTTNPDLGAMFPHAVPSLATGLHAAIPRNDAEQGDPDNLSDHIKAIAFTAGFHFGFIEQGGTSLYAAMARKVTNLTALEVVLGIGGAEVMHFQTWQDKAGNATPLTDHDPINNSDVTFEDLHKGQPEELQANLIMPEPCQFIDPSLPACSVIRPIGSQQVSARGAISALTADGLFRGQSTQFFKALDVLAQAADAARRSI
ncbi:MAG TPA: ferritin-like domain-containing protein [Chthoniobacterales bacterium]|nr:ferritin-like domain-containing protein [Chthoniobacterales bacterium]